MATKKSRKQYTEYTLAQKYEYHRKRRNSKSKNVSDNQRNYSDNWVQGFVENPSLSELKRTESWYVANKKDLSVFTRSQYQGYINGGKAANEYYKKN